MEKLLTWEKKPALVSLEMETKAQKMTPNNKKPLLKSTKNWEKEKYLVNEME